jgi:outer membrane protein OmpA-like peptidoglycan-associated protein
MRIKFFIFFQFIFLFLVVSSFAQKNDTLFIYYSIDSSGLEGEFKNDINNILKNDISEIRIASYTDFLGTDYHNRYLSNRRANEVRQFLLFKEVDVKIITECIGKGVYPNSSLDDRTNPDDRGVVRHRVSQVTFIYNEMPEVKYVEIIIPNEIVNDENTEELEAIPMFSNLTDENLVVGENIVLDNILFEGGTPTFKSESEMALKQLYLAMKNHPNLTIEIQGHICCQSDGEDGWDRINQNQNLSSNRAQAVYDYLIEAGIDKDRMSYVGFGSRHKLYPEERNFHEEDMNRRVEIFIVDK